VTAVDVTVTTDWTTLPATQNVTANTFFKILSASTCDVTIARIGLFTGTLTAAQILAEGGIPLTTAAAASNTVAGRYSSQYSGAQSLALGSVPFQMSDDHCVIAGAATADGSTIFMIGSTASNAPQINLDISAGAFRALWKDDTSVSSTLGLSGFVASAANVLSLRSTSGIRVLRRNGTPSSTSATVLGAATFNSAVIGVQRRITDSNFLTGSLGPVILIKGTVSDADILTLERFVANLTPNGPSF
jgi:hypothetical protein